MKKHENLPKLLTELENCNTKQLEFLKKHIDNLTAPGRERKSMLNKEFGKFKAKWNKQYHS